MDIKSVTSCIDLEAIDWRHPSQKADMNSISTEILSLILEHTATAYFLDGNPCAPIYSYERIGVLAQVCRRFNNIVSGFPFRTLEFSFLYDQPIKVVPEHNFLLRRLLDRTNSPNFHRLRQHDVHDVRPRIYSDPSLGQKCRTLVVRRIVSFCMSVDCVSIVTSTLPNVVHLRYKHTEKLNRPFHAKMFSTMVKGFPRLRHLSISAQCLDRIVEACSSLPALRILEINRPLKEREDSCSIDLKMHRTAPITTLRLSDIDVPHEFAVHYLRQILQWPQALESFSFLDNTVPSLNFRHNDWDLDTFMNALEPHRPFLRHLELEPAIRAPQGSSEALSHFISFPHLETLTLDAKYLSDVDPWTAAKKLLGSNLHTFGYRVSATETKIRWDTPRDSWGGASDVTYSITESCAHLVQKDSDWLHGLSNWIYDHTQKCSVRTIEVRLDPVDELGRGRIASKEAQRALQAMKGPFSEKGLRLVYRDIVEEKKLDLRL